MATVSPTFLSQRVTVPSVTDSPSAGSTTSLIVPILTRAMRVREAAYRRALDAPHRLLRSLLGVRGCVELHLLGMPPSSQLVVPLRFALRLLIRSCGTQRLDHLSVESV